MTKDNIMKMTDGLFHQVFDEIAPQYPEVAREHMIIDIGSARMADTPEVFDVVVTPNLYGDIISDIAAQVAGSVGLAGSANIGDNIAMFEAIHGSAPDLAGKNVANPSGLLLAGVQMLIHIGQPEAAMRVHNAWLRTLEEGIHTFDIYTEGLSTQRVGTREFTEAVIARLGQLPQVLKPVAYQAAAEAPIVTPYTRLEPARKELVGVDVFLHWRSGSPDELAAQLLPSSRDKLALTMITNRGVKVWPGGMPETFCTDHWRCRFLSPQTDQSITHGQIIDLLGRIEAAGLDFIKCENLCYFDGKAGFALGQGQ